MEVQYRKWPVDSDVICLSTRGPMRRRHQVQETSQNNRSRLLLVQVSDGRPIITCGLYRNNTIIGDTTNGKWYTAIHLEYVLLCPHTSQSGICGIDLGM